MDLTVMVSTRRDESLLELAGVLDYTTVPYVRQVVFARFDAGSRWIVLDAAGLRLIDEASINMLGYLQHRAERRNGGIRLTHATGIILTAIEIAGAAERLHVDDELDWPTRDRQRHPVPLDQLPSGDWHWPPEATETLTRLHTLQPDDPTRQRVRAQIIEACLPAAHRLARRYAGSAEPVADLLQVQRGRP